MTSDQTPGEAASELADAIYSVMPLVVTHVNSRLEQYDMNHTDLWALRTIDNPMPMKELAACMDFDPSYVTVVADRLEQRGLLERQPHATDRRIKNLVLTSKGERLRKSIPEEVWSGETVFSPLTETERADLLDTLQRLAASAEEHAHD